LTEKLESWSVPPHTTRVRLDQYLLRLMPNQSRSQIQTLIRKGLVRVDNREVKTGYALKPDDKITVQLPSPPPVHPHAENIPLNILYEDADLAVIEKPAGMVCHLGAGVRSGTLVNALLFRMGPLDTGDPIRPGIVHRLDKLTSGVMVVAKNSWAHRALARQFKSREVKKEYLALVHGRPIPPVGTINLPLGRDPQNRKKISVRARKARSAITHYRILKEYEQLSLLQVQIETGRTHQIRVHLAQMGHPVVGDTLYGGGWKRRLQRQLQPAANDLDRVFLHAHRLEFRHPRTGQSLSFTSPLTPELQGFLELLR
jgi:23S rRNA pseudouridine1911/1915/1917 synthase